MKKTQLAILFAALNAFTATGAFAQSNFTMYGVIDTVVRHTNNEVNADGSRGSKTTLEQGVFQGSRAGFKGSEDLSSGMAAVFQLEMGFVSTNGTTDQQGQLFGRQAFVGLKDNSWGEIDLGRQYGVAFDILGNYDPLGLGNLPENAWQIYLIGLRFDNTLKYTTKWGPVSAEVQYSFGEQRGSMSQGSTAGLGLTYANGPFSIGVFDQQSKDLNLNKANIAGIGASFSAQSAKFYLNYINARRDAGFVIADSNSGGALANTSMLGNVNNTLQRTDNVITAGLVYQATPKMNYTLGYMTDSVKNESSTGNDGRLSTVYAVVDYSLSKRTDVYVDIDYTKASGGEIDNGVLTNSLLQFGGAGLGGASHRTGIAVGLRTMF